MLLLKRRSAAGDGPGPVIALFGIGLIGSAVRDALVERGFVQRWLAFDWVDGAAQALELEVLSDHLRELGAGADVTRIDLVWTAGRAGFDATPAEVAEEAAAFDRVLACACDIARRGALPCGVSIVSSIGGLFEGQRRVHRTSKPSPLRPYGALKARIEDELRQSNGLASRNVYRLTSVFGIGPEGARRGLIAALLADAALGKTTRIRGNLTTLRDYVWSEDIGRYVTSRLLSPSDDGAVAVETLASGRPRSIHEVIHIVQELLDHPLYIQFDRAPTNSADITVAMQLLPGSWRPSDLKTSIARLLAT